MRGNFCVPIIRNGGGGGNRFRDCRPFGRYKEAKRRRKRCGKATCNTQGKEKVATEMLGMLKNFEEWLQLLLHFKFYTESCCNLPPMPETFSRPIELGGRMEGQTPEMERITRKRKLYFMFAFTLLREGSKILWTLKS